MNLFIYIMTIAILSTAQLNASYDFPKLEPIFLKTTDNNENVDFTDLIGKLPYPINCYGMLQEPENLTKLLEKVGVTSINDLCDDLNKGRLFLINAALHPDYVDCMVYVFLYTNLIDQLRKTNQLDKVLSLIQKNCSQHFKDIKDEYSGYLSRNQNIELAVIDTFLPLTVFFSTDEFLHEHLISYCATDMIFLCNNQNFIKMLFISILTNKFHVIKMLKHEKALLDNWSESIRFQASKMMYINLLKYLCKAKASKRLRLLLCFLYQKCKFIDVRLFERNNKFSANEINEIIDYAEGGVPDDVLEWINTAYLKL